MNKPRAQRLNMTESVRDVIDRVACSHPDKPYLIDPNAASALTYAQLQEQARAVASFIAEQGVERGASVAYAMGNGHCCAVSLLGIMYGGYRAVAINLVAGRDVIAYVLAHSQTALVLSSEEHAPLIVEALNCDAYVDDVSESSKDANATVENHADTNSNSNAIAHPKVLHIALADINQWVQRYVGEVGAQPGASDDALLMYTSGTTGRPKGVTLSHSNVLAGGQNVVTGHELTEHDRALCVLPLYHINGLCVTLFGPLTSLGSLVLPKSFSTSAFWNLIDEHQCTWFSVVPTQIAYLLRDADNQETSEKKQGAAAVTARAHLRFGRSASAPLSPDMHGSFEKRFAVPIIETMGLTETAAQILSNPHPPGVRKLGSPGLPVGDEVSIVDSQLNPVPQGEEGELVVRGPNVMQRYFRNPVATADALTHDGWLRTGDLGRKDEQGYVFITGRLKELIIKGGENIAPREIDDALYQFADVVEAAAFARPCDDFGQRVEAAVVLKVASELIESDLLEACMQRVGKFKSPDRIHFMTELPKGPSGKIQRAKIGDLIC